MVGRGDEGLESRHPVHHPGSTSWNQTSGTNQNDTATNPNSCAAGNSEVAAPANGVVYVQTATSAQQTPTGCSSSTLPSVPQNPFEGDNSSGQYSQLGYYDGQTATPDCEGDAFVSGTVSGALTVATQNDVIIDGNITYTTTDCGASFDSTYARSVPVQPGVGGAERRLGLSPTRSSRSTDRSPSRPRKSASPPPPSRSMQPARARARCPFPTATRRGGQA